MLARVATMELSGSAVALSGSAVGSSELSESPSDPAGTGMLEAGLG
jgi:hypothetical protein